MIPRPAKPEDYEQINKLSEKHNIDLPNEGKLIVLEDNGEIKAFVNIRPVLFVEPFISESPIATIKLWGYIKKKFIDGDIKILRCFAQKKHKKFYEKLEFYEIFNDYVSMERNFYKELSKKEGGE